MLPSKLSPVTGNPVPENYVHSSSAFFRDTKGRHLLLRGVNLSGSSKSPLSQPSYLLDDYWESAERGGESFVGQPLRLDDGSADVHLARLRGWGFNMLRYVVTWESLEREGPGKFDEEFMDYTVDVLRKCKEYGFKIFMDPHQDVWSRFSGGSGAPYWTLAACGLNPRNFTATLGAYLHCEYPSPEDPDPSAFPAMIWSTNYQRLVCHVIFTLFWAGRDFAPLCIIDGVNIQEYLQRHHNEAFFRLAEKIRRAGDLLDDCVIGWDSMNEPGEGLIGYADVGVIPKSQALRKGPSPTAFDGMRLGMGEKVEVENWKFSAMGPARDGSVIVDPMGKRIWMDEDAEKDGSKWGWTRDPGWKLGTCVFALHGVWDPSSSTLLKADYFSTSPHSSSKEPVDFVNDYWRPAWIVWARQMREAHPEAIHFIQPPVFHPPPVLDEDDLKDRACVSCHYYDGLTLLTRHWNWFNADALGILRGKYSSIVQGIRIGEPAIRKCLREQLGTLKQDTFDVLGQYPTLIGEIGIPYDMDDKKAYGYGPNGKGKGDYSAQQKALDASLNACDGPNLLNYTIWTYCVDNSHQWGDNWNLEDLSLWSKDDLKVEVDKSSNEHGRPAAEPPRGLVASASSLPAAPSPYRSRTSDVTAGDSPAPSARASMVSSSAQSTVVLPYDVLTDGARAVGAFSRPFPVATVGIPLSVDFDIKSSNFRMQVEVYPEGEASPADVVTEIFLPWVHYASSNAPTRAASTPSTNKPAFFAPLIDKEASKPLTEHVEPVGNSPTPTVVASSSSSSPTAVLPPLALDVEIKVSTGRFELDGQNLKWWYPANASGGKQVHTIEVKRRGGPLKATVNGGGEGAGGIWDLCSRWL